MKTKKIIWFLIVLILIIIFLVWTFDFDEDDYNYGEDTITKNELKTGQLVLFPQSNGDYVSNAIQKWQKSPFSHVGLIIRNNENIFMVFRAYAI